MSIWERNGFAMPASTAYSKYIAAVLTVVSLAVGPLPMATATEPCESQATGKTSEQHSCCSTEHSKHGCCGCCGDTTQPERASVCNCLRVPIPTTPASNRPVKQDVSSRGPLAAIATDQPDDRIHSRSSGGDRPVESYFGRESLQSWYCVWLT